MLNLFRFGLAGKMIGLLLAFAMVPLAVISFSILNSFDDIKTQAGERFTVSAQNIADKVDRNLFERYGDVQAFALNDAVQDRDSWYLAGEGNGIVQAMNNYVKTYGIYFLTIMVDLDGKVVAVNSVDAGGATVSTSSLYSKNFSNSAWFRALAAGNYTTRMPFTASGNDKSTGSYIEDLHVDSDVKTAHVGNDGLTLGFSAPVYNVSGVVIGYWSNRTDFSLVEEIFQDEYRLLKQGGFPSAELTLLDKDGRIIVDYDPSSRKTESVVRDLDNVIMKFNLAANGVLVAERAVQGQTGHEYALHARKQLVQAGGYTHLKGALGYPGMNWGVLVRVPEEEAAPWLSSIENNIVMIIFVCIALVVLVGLLVGRSVVATILEIVNVTEKASKGDLSVRLEVDSKDEFGQLASAFNAMLERLLGVITEVRVGSNAILGASNEIARGNMDLSQRSEEQATSLEETASSMEEMTTTVKQNSDSADEANKLAVSARDQAQNGGEVVEQAVAAMGEINESSKKIADIIGVIDEIAFQTNLLALNAAVEAARAGDQGRGFAVVAGEVRTLAQRSADAAKEIKGLITESVAKAEQGSDLVNRSGETLGEIIGSVKGVAELVSEIAGASKQQSSGIEQVNGAVMQMNDMTQENSALVEEASAASKSMEDQAHVLIEQIDFFNVGDVDDGRTPVQRFSPTAHTTGGTIINRTTINRAGSPAEVKTPVTRTAATTAVTTRSATPAMPAQVREPGSYNETEWDEF